MLCHVPGGDRGGGNSGDQMVGQGVLMPPHELDGPGEMGKAVVLPKEMTAEQKKLVDDGWQKNAFNQYVSDMISVHRTLPDPRDDRYFFPPFMFNRDVVTVYNEKHIFAKLNVRFT